MLHVPSDDPAAYSEGEASQMPPPPSSQTSYNDSQPTGDADNIHLKHRLFQHLPDSSEPGDSRPFARSPPRAPRAMRERPRSVTPPPPQAPLSTYLALAEQDPSTLENPATARKLLVLDLNGTLLHRSPHNFRSKRERHERGGFLPRLRPVHPRPYMPAFRTYLFVPETKAWLDVMVWSSAQPHSVEDMVENCFGNNKEKLLAIWARDTLGLSNDHYFRKVQTVKDLTKPWSLLSSKSTDIPSSPHSSVASTRHSSPDPSSPSRPSDDSVRPSEASNGVSATAHSALTTLLLDDSPKKAELQPFNHVCIGEYTGDRRAKDLESLQKEQEWKAALEARQQLDYSMPHSVANADTPFHPTRAPLQGGDEITPATTSTGSTEDALAEMSKKRKRKEKKLQKRSALLEQMRSGGGPPDVSYDETLLAVIGVLEEIKKQANVAAWIRSGGLWGARGAPVTLSSRTEISANVESAPSTSATAIAGEDVEAQSDDSDLSVGKDSAAAAVAQSHDGHKRRKKRRRVQEDVVTAVGNDEETASIVPATSLPDTIDTEEVQKMWFEEPEVMAYWTARGRSTLERLGIPVEHGIER